MNMSGDEKYTHRKNADRSYDSICLQCFRTVATSSDELVLAELENLHKCSGRGMYANAIVESPSWSTGQYAL
jgi:hypothetical protein